MYLYSRLIENPFLTPQKIVLFFLVKLHIFILVAFIILSLFSLRFIKNIPSHSDCLRLRRDIPPKTRSTPEATLVVDLVSVGPSQ